MKKLAKNKTIWFLAFGIACFAFLSFVFLTPKLEAADEQSNDLKVSADREALTAGELLTLTVQSSNKADTKITLPISGNFEYKGETKGDATITEDKNKGNLVIDWPANSDKKVVLTLKALQPSTYSFVASTIRDGKKLESKPLKIRIQDPTSTPSVVKTDPQPKFTPRGLTPRVDDYDPNQTVQYDFFENKAWFIDTVNKELHTEQIVPEDATIQRGQVTFGDLAKIKELKFNRSTYQNYYLPKRFDVFKGLQFLWINGLGSGPGDTEPYQPFVLPESIGTLTNLKYLFVKNVVNLEDPVPEWIGQLTNLEQVMIGGNGGSIKNLGGTYRGTIPASIGNLQKLESLTITESHISGNIEDIESSVASLKNLTTLDLSNNNLTGRINKQFLDNKENLTVLDLSRNQLSGNIPASIGNLTNLQKLYLYKNELDGRIPDTITKLTNTTNVNLAFNHLVGALDPKLMDFFIMMAPNRKYSLAGNELSIENIYDTMYTQSTERWDDAFDSKSDYRNGKNAIADGPLYGNLIRTTSEEGGDPSYDGISLNMDYMFQGGLIGSAFTKPNGKLYLFAPRFTDGAPARNNTLAIGYKNKFARQLAYQLSHPTPSADELKKKLSFLDFLPDKLSSQHIYTIWAANADGTRQPDGSLYKQIYSGFPNEDAYITVPDQPMNYTVSIDNPNILNDSSLPKSVDKESAKSNLFVQNVLGYSVGGFRVNPEVVSSFKVVNSKTGEPNTNLKNTVEGGVGDKFTMSIELGGKGVPLPGMPKLEESTFAFPDNFNPRAYFFGVSDAAHNLGLEIDGDSFKVNGKSQTVRAQNAPGSNPNGFTFADPTLIPAVSSGKPALTISLDVKTGDKPIPYEKNEQDEFFGAGKDALLFHTSFVSSIQDPDLTQLSKSENVIVRAGELKFVDVPDVMNFNGGKISNKTLHLKQDDTFKLDVEDSRANKKEWHINFKQTSPFKNDANNHVLPNDSNSKFLFKQGNGDEKTIVPGAPATTVYDSLTQQTTSSTGDITSVSWKNQDDGFFLEVPPGVAQSGNYSSQFTWELVNGPV